MKTTINDIGEFGLIDRIARVLPTSPSVVEGIGDDCAVLRVHDRLLLVSCDMAIEDIDFRKTWMGPDEIGWKVTAASLSDIAAMGGAPLFGLIGLACPGETEAHYIEEVFRGISNAMSRFGAVVVGGDTSRSHGPLALDVTVIGTTTGSRYLRRGGAQLGDLLAVSGFLGQSSAGLHAFEHGKQHSAFRISHCHPRPRIAEGQWLCRSYAVHAAIDISDGLLQDAAHLADASQLGVNIQTELLPVSEPLAQYCSENGLNPLDFVLAGGEDFELAFSLSPKEAEQTLHRFHHEFRTPVTIIGEFTDRWAGVRIDEKETPLRGFEHFRK
ncbi:MAG: thiamine-phosphate kinase [Candidatus Hydrogenedentes bacterium]|nr:thiamine-phosphate kinase [Candidatus Hydrogenedentota bacterium]